MRAAAASALAIVLAACGPRPAADRPPAAAEPARSTHPEIVEELRRDLAAERHPGDGQGRAWLEAEGGEAQAAVVGRPGRWTIVFEAGEPGIAEGGAVLLQVSPFWGWSTPQVEDRTAAGYTEVTTDAEGLELEAATLDRQLLAVTVRGRAMAAGERLRLVYGAGPVGAIADRFAERLSRFWIAVDGDGDGVRALLADPPGVDVLPGPAGRLLLTLPSTARPGETVRLVVAVVDALGNAGVPFAGEVSLEASGPAAEVPERVRFEAADAGARTLEIALGDEVGVLRLAGRAAPSGGSAAALTAESNPLQVAERGARVLWADLQSHSAFSDGTALPEDLLRYARDVAGLDAVALTDHDHWGLPFLDQRPDLQRRILTANRELHEPGRFVTLHGYEWTNWVHGHRHVLYFDDEAELISSLDPETDHPEELWAALRGRRALTIAHHSAGGPIATDWSIAPDPELEPVTEVASVHGSSEAADSPRPIYSPVAGNYVRDALDRGYRLGLIGSSDGHDGHPGLGHLASPSGGLAAILSEELSRDGLYRALKARRAYATNGPRILLRVSFGGYPMGAEVPLGCERPGPLGELPAGTLLAQAIAPGALAALDVVRSGEVVVSAPCAGERECSLALEPEGLEAGEYLYVRAVQEDGGAAWASPFFFVDRGKC